MRKRSATKHRAMKNASSRRDAQLSEFETRDLGKDIAASGSARLIRPQKTTTIRLGEDLIAALEAKAAKKGIGYQTLLKMIVREHLDDY